MKINDTNSFTWVSLVIFRRKLTLRMVFDSITTIVNEVIEAFKIFYEKDNRVFDENDIAKVESLFNRKNIRLID
jgi:hypothetical protein